MDKVEFGLYLKKIRKERGLTIHQVETYTGVSNSYISLLERGKRDIPSPTILEKLAPLYKVPYDELMEAAGYIKLYDEANDIDENNKDFTGMLIFILNEGEKMMPGFINALTKKTEDSSISKIKFKDVIKKVVANKRSGDLEVELKNVIEIPDSKSENYIELYEHAKESGLTDEDIKEALEFAKKMKKKS